MCFKTVGLETWKECIEEFHKDDLNTERLEIGTYGILDIFLPEFQMVLVTRPSRSFFSKGAYFLNSLTIK